jgi:ankyrin repeat protein
MRVAVLIALAACGRIGVDRRDEHGMTALMYAAQRGDRAEAERLIARGASVNAVVPTRDLRELIAFINWMQQLPSSDIGYTPLHYAAQGGHADVARLLVAQGADVRRAARLGETAFDLAVWRSDLETMQLLTAAGFRPGPRHLATAVAHSSPDAVRFVLEHGADPNARPPSRNPRVSTPPPPPIAIMVAMRSDPAILKLLIDAGVDVNARDNNGWSALRWVRHSASRGRGQERATEIVAMLEAAGAKDDGGARADALFDAVLKKDVARVRAALRAGASPNSKDNRGVPPLIYAANLGSAEIVEALVGAGANVNASPEHDTTPLIAAVEGGSVGAVRKLLAAGAKIDQPDRLHRTPLAVASGWNRTEITSLLLASSAKIDPGALAIAALNGNADQVRMLLARGADPNAGQGHVLSEATRGCHRRDNTEVIRMLLDGGADPKVHDDYTALHRAAGLCEPEVIRLLLGRGADPNARDMSGNTPLVSAAVSGRLEPVRLLIAAGADVNVRNSDGKSVLEHAAQYPAVQEELRRAGAR